MSATTPLPTEQQLQRAKWDLLLADIEYRQEQMRLARQDAWIKPWQVVFTALATGAGIFAAGAAFIKLVGP